MDFQRQQKTFKRQKYDKTGHFSVKCAFNLKWTLKYSDVTILSVSVWKRYKTFFTIIFNSVTVKFVKTKSVC